MGASGRLDKLDRADRSVAGPRPPGPRTSSGSALAATRPRGGRPSRSDSRADPPTSGSAGRSRSGAGSQGPRRALLPSLPRAPPPPPAPRGSTHVTAARDEHLRQLLERRQTGRRDGDQRPPPRGHDPSRPGPLHAGRHVARPPLDDDPPQLGDDAERSRRPPHRRASIRNQSQKRNESCGKTIQVMKTDPPTVRSRPR